MCSLTSRCLGLGSYWRPDEDKASTKTANPTNVELNNCSRRQLPYHSKKNQNWGLEWLVKWNTFSLVKVGGFCYRDNLKIVSSSAKKCVNPWSRENSDCLVPANELCSKTVHKNTGLSSKGHAPTCYRLLTNHTTVCHYSAIQRAVLIGWRGGKSTV